MAQLSLTVLRCPDYGAAEQRQVRGVELTIGRGTECDWALPDPLRSLSRKHCRLEQVGAAWQVVDLSANGTFVNFDSEPIGRDQAQPLRDGDRLRLGDYELEVRLAQPTSPGLGSPFGAAAPSDLSANLVPGLAAGAGLGADSDDGLFAAVPRSGGLRGLGAAPAAGGFGSARLPGLDDTVPPEAVSDSLDLDLSGGLGSFDPSPALGYGAQDDHAAATGDAFVPPAVAPQGTPSPGAAPSGAQAIVPDDWLQSIALGMPAKADAAPDFDPATAMPPAALPSVSPLPLPDPGPLPAPAADPLSADVSHWAGAEPLPFDELAPEVDLPTGAADPHADQRLTDDLGADPAPHSPAWQVPADVPLSGPGPSPDPMAAERPVPLRGPAQAPDLLQPAAPLPARAAAAVPAVAAGASPAPSASLPSTAPGADTLQAALAALISGGGLPPDALQRATQDPEATLRHAGALLQVAVAGLRALLVARGLVKREFRIEQTMLRPKENNPLKFAASDEHALSSLLDPRMAGLTAVQDAVDDLSSHEVAVLAATQAAAHALLEKLSPAALEADDPGGSGLFGASAEKRLWLAYKRRHATLMAQLEDDFDSAFGIAFARAYEQAVGKRKG